MRPAFKGRTVMCGPHRWEAEYPILDAREVDGCVCLVLDYSKFFPRWRQARNLRGFTAQGQPLWIAEHPTSEKTDCYTAFLDKGGLLAVIAEDPGGPVAQCFAGFLDQNYVLVYNFAGYQC